MFNAYNGNSFNPFIGPPNNTSNSHQGLLRGSGTIPKQQQHQMHHQQTMLLLGDKDDDNNSLFGLQSGSSFNRSNASINNSGGNSGAFNSNNNNNNKSNFGLIGSGINTPVVGSHQHSVGNNFNSSFSTRIQNNVFTSSNQSNSDVNKGFPMNQGSNRAPGSSLTANPLMQQPISSETSTSRSIQDGLNNSTVPINSMNSWGSGSSFYSPFSIQQTSSSNEFFSSTAAQHPFKTSNSSNFQQQHASLFPSNVTTRNSKINSTTSSRLSYLSSTLSLAEDDDDKFMGTTNPLYEDSTQQQSQQYLGRNTVTSHGSSTSTLFSTSGLSNQHQHTPLTHASSPSTSSTSERTSPGNSISYSNENTTTPSPPPPQFLSSTPEYHNRVMGSSIPIIGNGNTSQLPFNNIGGPMNFIPTSSAFPPNAFHQQAMFGNVMFMNASNAMPTPTNLGPQVMPNIGMGPFILTTQPMGFVPMSGNSGFVNNSQQSSLNDKQSSTASSDEKNPKPTQTNNLEKSHLTSQPSTTNTAVPPQQNVPQISPIPPTDEIIKQQNINGTKNIEEPKNTGIAKQSKPTTSNSSTNLKEEKISSKSATKQSKKQKHKNEETTSQPTITAAKDTEKTEQEKLDEELAKKLQREFEMEYLKSLDAGSNRNKGSFISTSKKKKGGESTADTIEDTKPSAASSTSSSNFFSILESTSTTDTLDASKTAKKSAQPPQQPSASKSSKKSKKKKKAAANEVKEAAASNAVATTTNINRELQIQEAIENNLPKGDASNTTPTSPQESIETTQTNVTVTTDTNLSSTKKTSSENYNKPCKDHFKGKCKFGSGICPYSHDRSFYVKYQQEHPDEFPPLPQPKSKKKDTSHEMVDHTPQKKVEVCVKHSSVQACPNGKNCKYIHFSDISQHDLYRKCCTGHSDRICKCAPQNASPVLYVEGVTKLSKKQMQEIAEKSFMKPVGVFKMTEQELVSNLPELKTLSPNEKKQRRFCYIFPDTCVKFVISKIERSEANRVKKLFNETEEEENRKRKAEMQGQKYDQEKDDEANPTWQILGLSSHQHCILRFIEERLPLCFVTPDCDRYNEGEPFDDALYGHHITFKQRQSYPTIIERIFEMVEPDDEPEEDISKELLMMMLGKVADAKKNSTTGFFTMGCIGPFQM